MPLILTALSLLFLSTGVQARGLHREPVRRLTGGDDARDDASPVQGDHAIQVAAGHWPWPPAVTASVSRETAPLLPDPESGLQQSSTILVGGPSIVKLIHKTGLLEYVFGGWCSVLVYHFRNGACGSARIRANVICCNNRERMKKGKSRDEGVWYGPNIKQ